MTYKYGELDGIYAKQIVQAGETAIEPDVPSKQGYQFTDWYLDDTKYDFNAAVTGDMTLTAKWTVCDHKDSTAQPTYTTPAICTACGGTLAALGHKWGPWTSGGNNTHTRTCKRDGSHTETKDCSGGTATCTEKAKCSVCGAEYGDLNPAHHANLVNVPAKAATTSAEGNIEYWHCGGCGKYYKDAAAQDEIKQENTVIAKRRVYYAPSLYPVRNGTNPPSGTEYSGGVYGLIFRAAVSGITGVQVDGRTVGKGSYTVEGELSRGAVSQGIVPEQAGQGQSYAHRPDGQREPDRGVHRGQRQEQPYHLRRGHRGLCSGGGNVPDGTGAAAPQTQGRGISGDKKAPAFG